MELAASDAGLLPMARICPDDPNAKIMDCILSNYNLAQSVDDIARYTMLDVADVRTGIDLFIREDLVRKCSFGYVANFKSDRVMGLFGYCRATLDENLENVFSS